MMKKLGLGIACILLAASVFLLYLKLSDNEDVKDPNLQDQQGETKPSAGIAQSPEPQQPSDPILPSKPQTGGGSDQAVQSQKPPTVRLAIESLVQENEYYCVPTCAQMVLRYKGILMTQAELAKEMKAVPVTGTEYIDFAKTLNKYLFQHETIDASLPGYQVQTLQVNDQTPGIAEAFERRVKADLATSDPVFAAVDVQALYPQLAKGNHMVVVIGYTCKPGSDDIESFYYLDPSYVVWDQTYGGLKQAGRDEFIRAILVNEEPAYLW